MHCLRRLFVTCGVFARYFFVAFSWFFRGFFVALFCLEKQCSGLFRYFFVAPVLGKFYAYSPWNSLLIASVSESSSHNRAAAKIAGEPRNCRFLSLVVVEL